MIPRLSSHGPAGPGGVRPTKGPVSREVWQDSRGTRFRDFMVEVVTLSLEHFVFGQ